MKQVTVKETLVNKKWMAYNNNCLTNGEFLLKKEYLDPKKSSPSLVVAVSNCTSFVHEDLTNFYNLEAITPTCSDLIPDVEDKTMYILNKTKVMYEASPKITARVFTVKDGDKKLNILIDEKYAKMFEGFRLVILDFINKVQPVIALDDDCNIVGLIMPVVNPVYQGVII